ncbi:MAG: caspase family protein [Candidatus Humimicrobiaceae bacterium]
MRKALVVGVNYYKNYSQLYGCVTDACNVKNALERNADGTLNFDVQALLATNDIEKVSKSLLKEKVKALFAGDSDIALFYYSGHGYIENTSGYLVTSECAAGDDGLPLTDLMTIANESKAKNKVNMNKELQ